jgi:uncharacterized membrane protein YGL010W
MFPRPQKTLRGYLEQYASEHTKLGTKLTHMVGIPMIVASIPTSLVNPPLAGGLFVGGWALQFIGHAVFEKQKPSFFADPYYLLIGPVWVAIEAGQLVGVLPRPLFQDEPAAEAVHANGKSGAAVAPATA